METIDATSTPAAAPAGLTFTLENIPSGGSLVLNGSGVGARDVIHVSIAAVNATDVLHVLVSNAGATRARWVTTGNVECPGHRRGRHDARGAIGKSTDTLTVVVDADATTIAVTGNAHLTLTSTNSEVTVVDASGMAVGLTYQAAGGVSERIIGGAVGQYADRIRGLRR